MHDVRTRATDLRRLAHDEAELVVERLCDGGGPPLLLLHALRGSRADWDAAALAWPGPVWALDLCGHGDSDWLRSSAYAPEVFAADADIAAAAIGAPLYVAGAGVGGYAALLLAGARNDDILGAAILPGAGLHGGDDAPSPATLVPPLPDRGDPATDPFDPRVEACERDPRPPHYAAEFARRARRLVLHAPGAPDTPWWRATREAGAHCTEGEPEAALEALRG